jgi:hypothetical protein
MAQWWDDDEERAPLAEDRARRRREALGAALGGTQTQTQTTPSPTAAALMGWNQAKWDNPEHKTPKYQLGRIFSRYDPKQGFTDPLMAEIRKLYPNAVAHGDVLSGLGMFEGADLGNIDAIIGSKGSNPQWGWQPETDASGRVDASSLSGTLPSSQQLGLGSFDDTRLRAILQALAAYSGR